MPLARCIDLNCDLGEGAPNDAELMPLITSANIACGGHASDPDTMRTAVGLAIRHGVAIGAHPGLKDRESFGRRELPLTPAEVDSLVRRQIAVLDQVTRACGGRIAHVKPHGALYNLASRDPELARAVAAAVYESDPRLVLVGLAGSRLLAAGLACGLAVASEVFADRTYQPDGSLTPRTWREALIEDESAALSQVLRILREGVVSATDGTPVAVAADTICLHGDGPHAVAFARRLRQELAEAGVMVQAPGAGRAGLPRRHS